MRSLTATSWAGPVTILLCAFLLRSALGIGLQLYVIEPGEICLIPGDAQGYWALADRISKGKTYETYSPPRRILRMPGFPLLLAGCRLTVGENLAGVRIVLAAVGTLACGLVYLLARRLANPASAYWALLVAAFSPSAVLFSELMLSETLFACGLLLSLWLLVPLVRPQPPACDSNPPVTPSKLVWQSLFAGVGVAAATYVRPTWLVVGPGFCLVWILFGRERVQALLGSAVLLFTVAVCLTPWTIRNWSASGGHFVPTTLWFGASLYDGLSPRATGESDMRFVEEDGVYQRLSEYDADQYYRRKAVEFVREQPGRALELAGIKLLRYFNPWPNASVFQRPLPAVLLSAFSAIVAAAALYGAWQHRRDGWLLLCTAGPVLLFAAIHAVFVGSIRYRLPAEYALYVLSGIGLAHILSRNRQPQPLT